MAAFEPALGEELGVGGRDDRAAHAERRREITGGRDAFSRDEQAGGHRISQLPGDLRGHGRTGHAVYQERERSGHPELPGSGYLDKSTLRVVSDGHERHAAVRHHPHHAATTQGTRPDRPRRAVRGPRHRADLSPRGRSPTAGRSSCPPPTVARATRCTCTGRRRTGRSGRRPAQQVCVTVTHTDGLVCARSVFSHSVNYRSAVIFGGGGGRHRPGRALAGAADHHRPPDPGTVGRGAAADDEGDGRDRGAEAAPRRGLGEDPDGHAGRPRGRPRPGRMGRGAADRDDVRRPAARPAAATGDPAARPHQGPGRAGTSRGQ